LLKYIPKEETDKLLDTPEELAEALRINALYMVQKIGKGHLGTSLSSMEAIVATRHLMGPEDIFISSKGHDAVAQYAALVAYGFLDEEAIHTFRAEGGLPGHPTVDIPGVRANTGSLGMGLSKALGFGINSDRTVFVLLGDGEMMEGQNWEAALAISKSGTKNIIAMVDYNGYSQDGLTDLSYQDIRGMFRAAGWQAVDVPNGNNMDDVIHGLDVALDVPNAGPWVVMMRTKKGSGIEEIEDKGISHFGSVKDYDRAFEDLLDKLPLGTEFETTEYEPIPPDYPPHPSMAAFGLAVAELMAGDEEIIFVGADTMMDLQVDDLAKLYPGRVFDFGIAEQNAISFASAQALLGKKPIVATYACFIRRGFEQIYNQVTEDTNVTYVGTMAGELHPSGPGISHQSLDDFQYMNALMPAVTLFPNGAQAIKGQLLEMIRGTGPSYLRLTQA
jgi:transketolase